jgi:hypothetical protein
LPAGPGGQGGGPTPAPTSSGSPTASPAPTASAHATATPTAPPTPAPTVPPTAPPTATPAPTAPPTAPPTATPGPSAKTISPGEGYIIGTDDQFNPTDGDTATGGQGQAVDGITCDKVMFSNYHVHVYVGILVNGQQIAIPDGMGMENPQPDATYQGIPNWTTYATCFYHIHTHDASGIVHLEDPNPTGVPVSGWIFTLGNVMDVWGQTLNALQFGPYAGPVQVVTSGQVYRGGTPAGFVSAGTYSVWNGDPNQIPLYSHEVIWIEVGANNPPPNKLPNIEYVQEY